jgi:ABC-type transport system involved in multi-copper enzyme maturation permease subunit
MERREAWWGYSFVVVLLIGQLMVSLPASDDPALHIRQFYSAHQAIIVVAQVLSVLASLLFVGFAVSLSRRITSSRSGLILAFGLLVALASLVTVVPPLALALSAHRSLSSVHALARAGDITDAVLFGVIALFAAAVWTERLPGWLRGLSAAVAVFALARAIISPLGSAALDVIAPIAFIALVLAISHWVLARPREHAAVRGESPD